MKRKVKVRILVILTVIVFAALIALIGQSAYKQYNRIVYDISKYEVKDFDASQESFDLIAARLLELYDMEYDKNPNLNHIYTEYTPTDTWTLNCVDNAGEKYTVNHPAEPEEREAYHTASQSLAKAGGLLFVRIMRDRVVFVTCTPYALIYMRNGSRPTFIIAESEGYEKIFVERIAFKWYQGIGKPYN